MEGRTPTLTAPQAERCRARLAQDIEELVSAAATCPERLEIDVARFGPFVLEVKVVFPRVRTAFRNLATQRVEARAARVSASIRPNAGDGFAYPFSPPEVRVRYRDLPSHLEPWLGGLFWLTRPGANPPPGMEQFLEGLRRSAGDLQAGVPCLWRKVQWTIDSGLVFVVRQLHRLLVLDLRNSPRDNLNPAAAAYWAEQKDIEVPLEQPIPSLSRGQAVGTGGPAAPAPTLKLIPISEETR